MSDDPILDAIDLLDRDRVEYVLIGGSAAILRGAAYVTQDVDFCCSRELDNLDRIARVLNSVNPRAASSAGMRPFRSRIAVPVDGLGFEVKRLLRRRNCYGCEVTLGALEGTSLETHPAAQSV